MFEIISAMVKSKLKNNEVKINPDELIAKAVEKNPRIKNKLTTFAPEFAALRDEWVFGLVSNLATFRDLSIHAKVDLRELIGYLESENSSVEETKEKPEWVLNGKFEEIDARKLSGFFLKDILNKEASLQEGTGLKVIQNFHAAPLITLLESKGYKSFTEKVSDELFYFYFMKENGSTVTEEDKTDNSDIQMPAIIIEGKPQMVVQSATPVVYPILLKLLQSEKIKENIDITEYKVWEETEKHLGWIVNGKADLSFSAILAMSNLASNKDIVKLTSITVWDNFYLLTRGYKAESWEDLKERNIYMPLFFNAPPAKVTHYLMSKEGFNPKDFNFVYGKPFGRPEEIYRDLVSGKIDTALLREPEVSYALVNNDEISVAFSYNELWRESHPESKGLPNAGVVFKREWFEKYPAEAELLMMEIDKATQWVKKNPAEAAELSYKEMGHTYDEVYKFLTRVHYENVPAEKVENEIFEYLSVIDGEEKTKTAVGKMLHRSQ